ncbi:vacuolar protein sorting-associated protein 37B-like isoform X2 [Anneissia japonica]|uniref:vacuolar protein sorting-associated protein 37B-like isoform X2 n=1 Tax=Anneissia japonica TaxID=1529436 RepID=UPI0014255A9F|nr:vacuolar protein sorting-associated protein 37B-like isoform X2 [Anneissia japonica]
MSYNMSYQPAYSVQRPPYPAQPQQSYQQQAQPRYPAYPSYPQYTQPPQPSRPPQRAPAPPPPQPAQRTPPKEPSQFPLLEKLTTEELQALLENEDKIIDMVKDLESVQKEKLNREMCLAENRSLAEFNLSREPRLIEGRQKLARSYEKNQKIREAFEQHSANLAILSSKHSLDSVLALLQAATSQTEDDAEVIADEFLDGKKNVDDFIEEFKAKRIVYNLKKTKSEELAKLMRKQQQTVPSSFSHQPSIPPHQAPYSSHQGYPGQSHMSAYNSSQYMPQQPMPTIGAYPR